MKKYKKMKKFKIQTKKTELFIDEFDTIEQARIELKLYELYDHKDKIYTPDFYEIIENEQEDKKSNKKLN